MPYVRMGQKVVGQEQETEKLATIFCGSKIASNIHFLSLKHVTLPVYDLIQLTFCIPISKRLKLQQQHTQETSSTFLRQAVSGHD